MKRPRRDYVKRVAVSRIVSVTGSIGVAEGTWRGRTLRFCAERRALWDIACAIDRGEDVIARVESWQTTP